MVSRAALPCPPKANQYLTLSAQDVDVISHVPLTLGFVGNQQAHSERWPGLRLLDGDSDHDRPAMLSGGLLSGSSGCHGEMFGGPRLARYGHVFPSSANKCPQPEHLPSRGRARVRRPAIFRDGIALWRTIGRSGTFRDTLKGCVPFRPAFQPIMAGHFGTLSRLVPFGPAPHGSQMNRFPLCSLATRRLALIAASIERLNALRWRSASASGSSCGPAFSAIAV
jgi:hypothetical protein